MKRLLTAAAALLTVAGCSIVREHQQRRINPYTSRIFYTKYLDPANPADARIESDLAQLRANPRSAPLHNDLGQLLAQKGFPKDAELEFERAVNTESNYYPAWYNLGLMRSARGDFMGSRIAFGQTLRHKPGHSAALFQMGLIEERRGDNDAAIDDYAKAFTLDRKLLDVRYNPRLLDSKLVDMALLRAYPKQHTAESVLFQTTPPDYGRVPQPAREPTASPVPRADQIVTPAAPVTDPSQQNPPPTPPASVPPPPRPPSSHG